MRHPNDAGITVRDYKSDVPEVVLAQLFRPRHRVVALLQSKDSGFQMGATNGTTGGHTHLKTAIL
jgi:hypothetical protein